MLSLWKGLVVLIAVSLLSVAKVHSECDFDYESLSQHPQQVFISPNYYHSLQKTNSCPGSYITLICSQLYLESLSSLYEQKGCQFRGEYLKEIHVKILSAEIFEETTANNEFLHYKHEIKTVDFSFTSRIHLPLMIFEFDELQSLNMSRNAFISWPYSNFQKLNSLQSLDLSNNNLHTFGEQIIDWAPDLDDNLSEAAEDEQNIAYRNPVKAPIKHVMALISLNLEHNYIKSIPHGLFVNFNNLEKLNLSHNMISSLDGSSFDGLINIVYLDISYNNIKHLNLAIMRLRRLKELHVNNNDINTINTLDFSGLDSLITLTLNNNKFNVDPGIFNSLNVIEELNLSHNEITRVTKELFADNGKLTTLDLSYNVIYNIEQGAFKNGNLITAFEIQGNNILGPLLKGHLEGLTHVNDLNLSNHSISQIEGLAFLHMTDLLVLNISNNALMHVSKFAFKTLNNLTYLDLSKNILTVITFDTADLEKLVWISLKNNKITEIPPTFLQYLPLLEVVDMSENNIVRLPSDIFKSLQYLTDLHFENNPLSGNIEEKTFHNLESLPSLDLSNTNITSLHNNSFSGMKALRIFNISNSDLSTIQFNAFSDTESLEVLDGSHNRLTAFSVNTSQITHLEVLILSHNLITYIRPDTLINIINLKQLRLSNNKLARIENESFNTLLQLEELDIAFNKDIKLNTSSLKNVKYLSISGVVPHHDSDLSNVTGFKLERLVLSYANLTNLESLELSTFAKLEVLDLSINDISHINNRSFQSLPVLQTLDLHSNKIQYIQPGSFMKTEEITLLNLSDNEITTIAHGIFLGLRNLRTLDLSHNKIQQIDAHKLFNVPLLDFLIIDGNYINYINFLQFVGTELATISLGDNPFPCQLLIDYRLFRDTITRKVLLTAISLRHDIENVDGITCKGAPEIKPVKHVEFSNISLNNFVYNTEITNNLLEEIKSILESSHNQTHPLIQNPNLTMNHIWEKLEDFLNASKRDIGDMQIRVSNNFSEELKTILKSLSSANQTQVSLPNVDHVINEDILKRIGDIIINVSRSDTDIQNKIYNEMKKENSHVDEILKYLYEGTGLGNVTIQKFKQSKLSSTSNELTTHKSTSISVANQTSNGEKLKNELKEFLAHERNNMINEIKSHLTTLDTRRQNDSAKNAENSMDESVSNGNPTSKFTEVSVGIILAIVLGFVMYKVYTKNVFPKISSMRSNASTQEISNAMEL